MSINLIATTAVQTKGSDALTVGEVKEWIRSLPDDAQIDAIRRDIGSQRDPIYVTIGLKATWTETR